MAFSRSKIGVGALILVFSGVLCKALGAFFRLPLTNLLGFEGIGIFQMIMMLYSFSLVLTSGGISTSMSKLISSTLARQKNSKALPYLKRALFVGSLGGALVGGFFFVFGRFVCNLQGFSDNQSYMLFLILLPSGAIIAGLRGFFQGYGNMIPTAVSQVVEQVAKFAFGLLFAFLFGKAGAESGVFGAFLGIVLSEVVCFLTLFIWFLAKREKIPFLPDKVCAREFDKTNFWIVLSASILPLTRAFDGLVVVPRLAVAGFSNEFAVKLFGIQSGVVGALLNLPLVISVAITTALLPNVSYAISTGASSKRIVEKGLKILLLTILPTTFGLVAISKQILPLCYSNMDAQTLEIAFNLMSFESFSIVFMAIFQFFCTILQANGNLKYIVFATAIGGAGKVFTTFFLCSQVGVNIYALALGNIIMNAVICILFLFKIKNLVSFKLKFFDLFILVFSTFCMFWSVYTFLKVARFGSVADIIIGVLIGFVVYCVFCTPFIINILPKRKKNSVGVR